MGCMGERFNQERVERHHGGDLLRFEGHFPSWVINYITPHKNLASWRTRNLRISQRGHRLQKRGQGLSDVSALVSTGQAFDGSPIMKMRRRRWRCHVDPFAFAVSAC